VRRNPWRSGGEGKAEEKVRNAISPPRVESTGGGEKKRGKKKRKPFCASVYSQEGENAGKKKKGGRKAVINPTRISKPRGQGGKGPLFGRLLWLQIRREKTNGLLKEEKQ